VRSSGSEGTRVKELENEVMRLKIDVGWRDKLLDKLEADIKLGQETLHGQARYIGHLESDLLRLGGKPDQAFLAAPTPQKISGSDQTKQEPVIEPEVVDHNRPHPDQQVFRSGVMG